MKSIQTDLKTGSTVAVDIPAPKVSAGKLLIRTRKSLVSPGTERMLVDFGKANLLEKARSQPDKVRMVLDKLSTDGVLPTIASITSKLDQPIPMGYCNIGEVLEVGSGVSGFKVGQRIASNGRHAEIVSVPEHLCVAVPDNVRDEDAVFTVLGSIALQGIRLVDPTLGETVAVIGLGILGLLTVQLLRAHGCRVVGLDLDPRRLELAKQFGALTVDLETTSDPVEEAVRISRGRGLDAVIITANTTSNKPIRQAAQMSRKRGRIVLVGVAGLDISRADFYEKELTFQVSCSYGPGRYDLNYEEKGHDYPIGYVRWTEQRNFEAVLDMMAEGRLNVGALISHSFSIEEADKAYEVVTGGEPSLGILLDYPAPEGSKGFAEDAVALKHLRLEDEQAGRNTSDHLEPQISVIGSGNYAGAVLLPAFTKAGARWRNIASSGGVTSVHLGRKFGFQQATTDAKSLLRDSHASAVVVATRHDTHASYLMQALDAGKHVFVEKPLALSHEELREIAKTAERTNRIVMVGFNRRFSPHVQRIAALLKGVTGPRSFLMTVNAGAIPKEHWTQDPAIGGGRLVGEGCHFIDLLRFLAGSPISSHQVTALDVTSKDSFTITLRFTDGSKGTIVYVANGSKSFPKERLEVFVAGRVLQLDNFRRLKGYGWPRFRTMNLWRQDKGQVACAKAFLDAIRNGCPSPIPLDELLEVGHVTLCLAEALQ
jgi:predicted dehydrogenase